MNNNTRNPSRLRSFDKTQISTPVLLKMILGRDMAPNKTEYEALAEGITVGDLPMDAFIEASKKSGEAAHRWRQFQQLFAKDAVLTGQNLKTGVPELDSLIESALNPPFAVDWALADDGAKYIQRMGTLAMDILRDMALMGGYMLSAFNKTLIMTGDLEKGTDSRVANTTNWWMQVTDTGANEPFAEGFKATMRVRWVHGMVRNQLKNRLDWDYDTYGLPISQVDMSATYLGFSLAMLLGLRKSGIYVTKQESRAVMHLWKIIGWQMGVSKEWLVDTEAEAIVLLRQFVFTHTRPDESSMQLARALSMEPLDRNYESLQDLRRRFHWLAGLSANSWYLGGKTMKKLGLKSPLGPWLRIAQLVPVATNHYVTQLSGRSIEKAIERGRAAQIQKAASLNFDAARVKKQGHPAAA